MKLRRAPEEHDKADLAEKVAFLSYPESYPGRVRKVVSRETHMSWVFFVDGLVYKLKKPVRFPYLDFSTLNKRESACRSELRLNRRLARDVYLSVTPLNRHNSKFAIGGDGLPVDWLVTMRHLDERFMLENLICRGHVDRGKLSDLACILTKFYRRARRAHLGPEAYTVRWRRKIVDECRFLANPRFGLDCNAVCRIYYALHFFTERFRDCLARRVHDGRIVDGHGDLRPEHVWLGKPIRIIDCLEFDPRLRMMDPFDEIAYLGLECERLGAPWIGPILRRRLEESLNDEPGDALFFFYRSYRALLKARLAIGHLADTDPQSPEKWRARAKTYLNMAARDAGFLRQEINRQTNRKANGRREGV